MCGFVAGSDEEWGGETCSRQGFLVTLGRSENARRAHGKTPLGPKALFFLLREPGQRKQQFAGKENKFQKLKFPFFI